MVRHGPQRSYSHLTVAGIVMLPVTVLMAAPFALFLQFACEIHLADIFVVCAPLTRRSVPYILRPQDGEGRSRLKEGL